MNHWPFYYLCDRAQQAIAIKGSFISCFGPASCIFVIDLVPHRLLCDCFGPASFSVSEYTKSFRPIQFFMKGSSSFRTSVKRTYRDRQPFRVCRHYELASFLVLLFFSVCSKFRVLRRRRRRRRSFSLSSCNGSC